MKTSTKSKAIESIQKVIKVGDSIAVTIPAKEARALNIKPGTMVRSRHEEVSSVPGVHVSDEYQKFTKQYNSALKNLSER